MDGYTKITAEVKYYDGKVDKFELTKNAWDMDGEQMGELFRNLMAAMGYAESTINSVFGADQDLYEEAACLPHDVGEMLYDPEPIEPCVGDTLANVFAALDDPCFGCSEACEDTACVHENDGGPIMPRDWHEGDGDNE
jgi:hypothetical protein